MKKSNSMPKIHNICFHGFSVKLLMMVITVSGFLGISSADLNHKDVDAQTLQQKCLPDVGIEIAKSNCFSNAPSSPVYNMTSTENVRPPAENTVFKNNSELTMNGTTN